MPNNIEQKALEVPGPAVEFGKAVPTPTDIIDEFDLESFRVDESMLGHTAREQVVVPVDKPSKDMFFRVHNFEAVVASLLKDSDGKFLLITAAVANDPLLAGHVAPYKLNLTIDRSGNLRLWPVRQVRLGEPSNGAWESAAVIGEAAKHMWVRMQWSPTLKAYDRYDAPFQPPEPEWPDRKIDGIVKVAFAGRVVTSLDHPTVAKLLGRI